MIFDQVQWAEFKTFVDSRSLNVQFRETSNFYFLKSTDSWFGLECNLSKADNASEVSEFEADYKADSNQPIKVEVTTQLEKNDKTLKIASGSGEVDIDTGEAVILILIPGTFGSGEGRWIMGGTSFFSSHTSGDKITGIYFTDEDNLLELGAGTIIGSYTDDDAEADNRGWVFPPSGILEAEALGSYGFAPAGFYIKIIGHKAGEAPTGTLYCNLDWAKPA